MAVTLEMIHREMKRIKNEFIFFRLLMEEDYELSDKARKDLQEAKERMDKGEYVLHEEVMKKYG